MNIKIVNGPIRLLGVYIHRNPEVTIELNFDSKIEALLRQLHWWKARDLSLLGKVLIAKSLALSKFQYLASIIPIPENIISKVNSIVYEFIWGGKTDKVKRDIFEQNFEKGGYNMVNFKDIITASSIMWIKKYLDNIDRDWKFTFEVLSKQANLNLCIQSNYDSTEFTAELPKYYLISLQNWFDLKHKSTGLYTNSNFESIIYGITEI